MNFSVSKSNIECSYIEHLKTKSKELSSIYELKKKGGMLSSTEWTQSTTTDLAQFVASCYQPGLMIIDMFDYEASRFSMLLDVVKDLNLSLVSPLSRPPAFKEKAQNVLGDRYKCFSRMPTPKRLLTLLLDSFEWTIQPKDQAILDSIWLKWFSDASTNPCRPIEVDFSGYPKFCTNPSLLESAALEVSEAERQELIIDFLKSPEKGLNHIQAGSSMHALTLSHLVGLGAPLPPSLKIPWQPKFDLQLGFGPFFANLGAMSILIESAKKAFENNADRPLVAYLECLHNFLIYPVRTFDLLELFCKEGSGIELIFLKNQLNSLLYHPNEQVQEWTRQILHRVYEARMLKRRCDHCGKKESRQEEFSGCALCTSVVYCSRSCQWKDWTETHCIECIWHRNDSVRDAPLPV